MNESPLAIGIDFGGTSVKTGVVCGSEIIDLAPPIATQDFSGADEIIAAIVRTVGELRIRHEGVRAVGIGVPGFVDFERRSCSNSPTSAAWLTSRRKKNFHKPSACPSPPTTTRTAWPLPSGNWEPVKAATTSFAYLLRQLYGPFRDSLAILPAAFGHEAGTVGAAALALEEAEFQ